MCGVSKLKVHKRCKTPTDPIAVIIRKDDENIEICKSCWQKISDKDWEVGDKPKPTMEEIISDKSRGIEGAIETEYSRWKKRDEETDEKDEEVE
jgi:hypothetical protein